MSIEIMWQPTGPAENEDFKATHGDYFLRVEKMDKKWWYALYYKRHEIVNKVTKNRLEAMLRVEIAMLNDIIESK